MKLCRKAQLYAWHETPPLPIQWHRMLGMHVVVDKLWGMLYVYGTTLCIVCVGIHNY